MKTIDDLEAKLRKAYKAASVEVPVVSLDLYRDALTTLDILGPQVKKKPDSEKGRRGFLTCSTSVEAAVAQIRLALQKSKAESLRAQTIQTLSALSEVHQQINDIQGDQASKLKSDLDAEREKARKLREEAEKKFSELQSALIQVSKDARGTIISMSDILFKIGKADLTPDLKTNLAKIAGILTVFKNSKIIVEGHTDNQGSEEYNQRLSEDRAENVMNFLIEQGVQPHRLTAIGYAFHRPIASNDTPEGRQKNRRVDLVVQEKNKEYE
ncbi:MAG: OmpA family protein [Chitinivibrionales bacterium]|nr:OmpA family protein [Chitinivibrionales bacterium]